MTVTLTTSPTITRRTFGLVGVGLTAIGVTACGGGARPGGGGVASGGGVTAWTLTGGAEEMFRTIFEEWNSNHSDRQIEVEYFANDAFKEKIRTAVGSGNQPTLVYSWGNGGTLRDYVASGKVVDLTGKVEEAEARSLPSVLNAGRVDGSLYAVPNNNTQPAVLYINTKLFNEYGATVPTTWDELMEAVGVFSNAGVTPIAVAGASQWPYLMWIQYLTDRIGGPEVFQRVAEGEADAWSDPAISSALEHIQELVRAGGFGSGYGSVVSDASADVALVHTDNAAMILQGSWVYSDFLSAAADWMAEGNLDVVAFPEVSGGVGDVANVTGNPANFWSVSADASEEQQQVAFDFLNEMNLSVSAVAALIQAGTVPAAADVEAAIEQSDRSDYLSFVYQLVSEAPNFQMSWDQALDAEPAQALLQNLSQIFLLEITPEEFVTNMNATLG